MRSTALLGILVLAGCGSVTGTGGNDIPQGPAVAEVGSGNDCTRPTGAGVDATVTPGTGGYPGQGQINVPASGLDPTVPPCFDYQAQAYTAPAMILTATTFTIRDGVLQAPPDDRIRIATQWFLWYEPIPGTCQAGVNAVVEVTDGAPTCSVELQFGMAVASPIYSYQTSGP